MFDKKKFVDSQRNLLPLCLQTILRDQRVSKEIHRCYFPFPTRDDIYPPKAYTSSVAFIKATYDRDI